MGKKLYHSFFLVGRQAPRKHDGSNIGAIAGSVTGGILLLIIIVVTITFLLRRKMTKTSHEESAKVQLILLCSVV